MPGRYSSTYEWVYALFCWIAERFVLGKETETVSVPPMPSQREGSGMYYGLVDRDITPIDNIERIAGSVIELEIGGPEDEAGLIDALNGKDIAFTTSRLQLTWEVLESTDLSVVAKIGTGIDNVDLEAAAELGIPVTHTPGVNALAVAEHSLCLILMITGRVSAGQDALREGIWRDELQPGTLLDDKTIGIIGYGNIGSRLATLLTGFNVEILAYDPYIEDIDTDYGGATLMELDALLEQSDVVSVNAELTPETTQLISDDELSLLGSDGFIVNTARGPIIDEAALITVLEQNEIAGAALDVFEEEPLPADSPLHVFENVITTPHIAGVRKEVREKNSTVIAENAVALLTGESVASRFMAVEP